MKKIQKLIGVVAITLIMATSNVYAYTEIMDPNDNITISDYVINGQGTVDITRDIQGYALYYQWVEMDNDTYKQIQKLKDELQVIQYYNLYEGTQMSEYGDAYVSAQEYYKSLYGEYVSDVSDQKVNENISIITSLLPEYTNNWTRTTDNTFNMDLSTFSGTKDYAIWVQLEKQDGTKIYDAETFELTGTKQGTQEPGESEDQKPGEGGDQKPGEGGDQEPGEGGDKKPSDDGDQEQGEGGDKKPGDDGDQESGEGGDQKPGDDGDQKPGENGNQISNDSGKTDDSGNQKPATNNDTTLSKSKLPQTGVTMGTTIFGIIASSIVAIVSFIKYKRIK